MAYFPFFVDIENQKCLIAGGGVVALRKVEVLLPYGPCITLVSPEIISELKLQKEKLSAKQGTWGSLTFQERDFCIEDLGGQDFVVAATDDQELNRKISLACRERRIPVNVVDVKDECSFIFPSIVREEDIVIGISSGGKSPTVTQDLKQKIRRVIPEGYGRLVSQLGAYRDFVKRREPDVSRRTVIFKRMVDVGVSHGCQLDDSIVEELIRQVQREWPEMTHEKREDGSR